MKKPKKPQRLILSRKTIRNLDPRALRGPVGGTDENDYGSWYCSWDSYCVWGCSD